MSKALDCNILVTRDLSDDQLSLAGYLDLDVVTEPAIRVDFRNDWLAIQNEIEQTDPVIFVFTSQNGVHALAQFIRAGIKIPDSVPVYAVGSKTEEALSENGFKQIRTPLQQNGVGLAHLIIDDILKNPGLSKATVLHFCGNKRRDELRHYLTDSDINIKDIVVYKTSLNQMTLPNVSLLDGILFYSPSSVQAFRQSGGFHQTDSLPELFAIGPTTAEELSIESGKHVHISPEPDTDVFLKFVARVLGETKVKNEK